MSPSEQKKTIARLAAIHTKNRVDRFMMQLIRKYKFLKACQFNIKFITVDNNVVSVARQLITYRTGYF